MVSRFGALVAEPEGGPPPGGDGAPEPIHERQEARDSASTLTK
jgi:hypothetical protein